MQKLVAHFREYCYYLNVGSEVWILNAADSQVTASSAAQLS